MKKGKCFNRSNNAEYCEHQNNIPPFSNVTNYDFPQKKERLVSKRSLNRHIKFLAKTEQYQRRAVSVAYVADSVFQTRLA